MHGPARKKTALYLIAGVCFLVPAFRFIYLYGFPGFSHAAAADGPAIAGAQLVTGTLFLLRFVMDVRKAPQ